MLKVGIITFLHNENYGSTLQAFALQRVLCSLGFDAVHIDYRPSSRQKLRNQILSMNSPALLLDSVRKRAVKAGQIGARNKSVSFDAFYGKHMKLTNPCRDTVALQNAATAFDVLLCGSDQIWSPTWFNPSYFLNFGSQHQKRIAYAPSLGVSTISSSFKRMSMKKLLRPFSSISAREEEGAAVLHMLTDKPIAVLPDPVILPQRNDWLSVAEAAWLNEPYIACYFIGDRPDYWEEVKALQGQYGYRVVVIPVTDNAYHQPYDMAQGLSPQAWLGVLNGACHVVTDSFHGTVFSLMLHRPVTILRRYQDSSKTSRNSRIDSLLRQLQLTDTVHPNWELVDHAFEHLRQAGLSWLRQALSLAD